jgi:hypothetical protein
LSQIVYWVCHLFCMGFSCLYIIYWLWIYMHI